MSVKIRREFLKLPFCALNPLTLSISIGLSTFWMIPRFHQQVAHVHRSPEDVGQPMRSLYYTSEGAPAVPHRNKKSNNFFNSISSVSKTATCGKIVYEIETSSETDFLTTMSKSILYRDLGEWSLQGIQNFEFSDFFHLWSDVCSFARQSYPIDFPRVPFWLCETWKKEDIFK